VIEIRDQFGGWTPVKEVPGGQTAVTIDGLPPNEQFQFRVRAKNKAGAGVPSDESDKVWTKPRRCKHLELLWINH
jgi:hypothetical protein